MLMPVPSGSNRVTPPSVPGASLTTKLLGVSRQGFKRDSGLDIEIGPEEIVAAGA